MCLLLFAFVPVLMSSTKASAQQNVELKIAIVDYNRVFYEYSEKGTQYSQLKAAKNTLEQEIKAKQQEIDNDRKIYEEQKQYYNDAKKRDELLKIWEKMLKLELKIKDDTKKLEDAEKIIVKQLNDNINIAIEKARSGLGYDIVINKYSVFAAGNQIKDITNDVLNILK